MLPDLLREGDFFASGGGFADLYSADLLGYLVPTRLHPLVGEWVATLPFANDKAQHIYIGYTALALAALGATSLWRRQKLITVYWSLNLLLFWLLTLGPHPAPRRARPPDRRPLCPRQPAPIFFPATAIPAATAWW